MPVTIEKLAFLSPEDSDAIAKIQAECDAPFCYMALEDYIKDQEKVLFGARFNSKIIAILAVEIIDSVDWIRFFSVRKITRRRGVASDFFRLFQAQTSNSIRIIPLQDEELLAFFQAIHFDKSQAEFWELLPKPAGNDANSIY